MKQMEQEFLEFRKKFSSTSELIETLRWYTATPQERGKLASDLYAVLMLPSLCRVAHSAGGRTEQSDRNLHLAFALAAHRQDNDAYPKTLDALTPKYLAKIPQDIFSGKELIYRRTKTGYLFYSVGPNGKDDRGRDTSDDVGMRMPAAKAAPR